jgi:hypothetical protein
MIRSSDTGTTTSVLLLSDPDIIKQQKFFTEIVLQFWTGLGGTPLWKFRNFKTHTNEIYLSESRALSKTEQDSVPL